MHPGVFHCLWGGVESAAFYCLYPEAIASSPESGSIEDPLLPQPEKTSGKSKTRHWIVHQI